MVVPRRVNLGESSPPSGTKGFSRLHVDLKIEWQRLWSSEYYPTLRTWSRASNKMKEPHIRLLERILMGELGTPILSGGWVVDHQGKMITAVAGGPTRIGDFTDHESSFSTHTKMRFASVSKMICAIAAHSLVRAGTLDLDADVSPALGFTLQNSRHPTVTLTLRQLLSHTSSVTDRAGYLFDNKASMARFFSERSDEIYSFSKPGTYFEYSNLGYILVATILERMTSTRFDHLVKKLVFEPAGMTAGFNWSSVHTSFIKARAVLYRWENGTFTAKADVDNKIEDGVLRASDGEIISDVGYRLGESVAALSPHGGARMSLEDAVMLGRLLREEPLRTALSSTEWKFNEHLGNGQRNEEGSTVCCFEEYGAGLHILRRSRVWPSSTLVGHLGNAYGFSGGVWYDVKSDVVITYALNGLSEDEYRGDLGNSALFGLEDEILRHVHDEIYQ